jgi:hypothetical protein
MMLISARLRCWPSLPLRACLPQVAALPYTVALFHSLLQTYEQHDSATFNNVLSRRLLHTL